MRYTRKYRNKAIGLQSLHKLLSRIDVEKDALHASIRISKDNIAYFHTCADRLFGELPIIEYKRDIAYPLLDSSLQKSTRDFLDTLRRYKVYKPIDLLESHNYTNLYRRFASVAPEIEEAIHDAGPSPSKYKPSIRILLNPGSYLDPGLRTPVSETHDNTGFHTPLTADDFHYLGIPNVQAIVATLHANGECDMKIQYIFTTLTPSFNTQYKHKPDALERFFDGNGSKNKWFNTDEKNDFISDQYILYKELGDMLQAYYAAKRIAHNLHQFKLCFFTNDTNALYRCILLHVPGCIAKYCGKNHTQFHYHPAMSDIRLKWIEQHRDALVEHNQDAMNCINHVLQMSRYYNHDGRCIHFGKGSQLAEFLENCIRAIRSTTERFLTLPTHTIQLQEYSKMCGIFKASRLFNQSVANRSSQALFVEPSATSNMFPKPFGDLLHSLQRGGFEYMSESEWAPYKQDPEQDDYSQIDPNQTEEHLPIVYVLQGLFALFQKRFPEKNTDQLRFLAEDINAKLIQFFGVSGRPSWEPDFLETIVDSYLNGTLQIMTHEEFERIHTPVIEKAMENDWEWSLLQSYMPPTPSLSTIVATIQRLETPTVPRIPISNLPSYRPLVKARRFTRRLKIRK